MTDLHQKENQTVNGVKVCNAAAGAELTADSCQQ